MSDWRLRSVCRCDHDRDTHYGKAHACLATACECRRYRLAGTVSTPPPPAPPVRPKPPRVDTLPAPHPIWCFCGQCAGAP